MRWQLPHTIKYDEAATATIRLNSMYDVVKTARVKLNTIYVEVKNFPITSNTMYNEVASGVLISWNTKTMR